MFNEHTSCVHEQAWTRKILSLYLDLLAATSELEQLHRVAVFLHGGLPWAAPSCVADLAR